ncbi:ubiquinone anaerobic biosynthesis accessory factor UbiT [Magnetococcales bacterium HHB-1]
MTVSWFMTPLKFMPKTATSVSLGIALNILLKHHPELAKRMEALAGKVFRFEVIDLEQDYFMDVDGFGEVKIYPQYDIEPDVTMSGDAAAFIALLLNREDPDSLFFTRKLELSGETDAGLCFKNILDSVDIDWEEEISHFVGRPVSRILASLGDKTTEATQWGKEKTEAAMDTWMEENTVPRQYMLANIEKEGEALHQKTEALASRIQRLSSKLSVHRARSTPAEDSPSENPKKGD